MKTNSTLLLAIAAVLLLLNGCAGGTLLATQGAPADLESKRGTYNLILYGGHNTHALRSIAILDRTDDPYTILPYGASFNYRITENLDTADALARGEQFLRNLIAYRATDRREVHGPDHTVIGYELRPLFMPFTTGLFGDILDTSYRLQEENRVSVYIDFKRRNQDPLDSDGGLFFMDN